jgi:hypothetical protein
MKKPSKLDALLETQSDEKRAKSRVNIYVSTETYRRFAVACEARNLKLSHVLDAFMEDFVAQHIDGLAPPTQNEMEEVRRKIVLAKQILEKNGPRPEAQEEIQALIEQLARLAGVMGRKTGTDDKK